MHQETEIFKNNNITDVVIRIHKETFIRSEIRYTGKNLGEGGRGEEYPALPAIPSRTSPFPLQILTDGFSSWMLLG